MNPKTQRKIYIAFIVHTFRLLALIGYCTLTAAAKIFVGNILFSLMVAIAIYYVTWDVLADFIFRIKERLRNGTE